MERAEKPPSPQDLNLHVMLRRRFRPRREGSLAAAVIQSMALAVMGTAGAYPSWVLVEGEEHQFVLGVAWVVSRDIPPPGFPLLGSLGGPLMLSIAFCCFFSVLSGTLALMLDFLGRREFRWAAPLLHGLTAVLNACAAALGSCLLGELRARIRAQPELRGLSISPGQSLFLACLACALASTAAGLSCSSPARVEPARSSWDLHMREWPRNYSSSLSSEDSFEDSPTTLSLRDDLSLSNESPSERVLRYVNQTFGHLEKRDPQQQQQQPPPEEGHSSGQEPKLEANWSALKRYWDSAYVLMGDFFQGRLGAPHVDENNAERAAAQQGVLFSRRPDSERRAQLESEAYGRTLEETSRI